MTSLPGFSKLGGVTKLSELEVDQTFDEAMQFLNQKATNPKVFQWNFLKLLAEYSFEETDHSPEMVSNFIISCIGDSDIEAEEDGVGTYNIGIKDTIGGTELGTMTGMFLMNSISGIYNRLENNGISYDNIFSVSGMDIGSFVYNDSEFPSDDEVSFKSIHISSVEDIIISEKTYNKINGVVFTTNRPILTTNTNYLDISHQKIRLDGAYITGVPRDEVSLIHFSGEDDNKYYYDADYDALVDGVSTEGKRFALYHYGKEGTNDPYLELVQIRGIPVYPLATDVQFHLSDSGEWMSLIGIKGNSGDPVQGVIPDLPRSIQEIHYYIYNYDNTFGREMGKVYLTAINNLTAMSNSFNGETSGTIYVTTAQRQMLLDNNKIVKVTGTTDEFVMATNSKVLVKIPEPDLIFGE